MYRLFKIIKRLGILILAVFATLITYEFIVDKFLGRGVEAVPGIFLIWLFTAYVVLPRIHRKLVGLYLPDYFIGRPRTIDGLLADPVNLAIIGTKSQLVTAMNEAGWVEADLLNAKSSLKILISGITNKSYPSAPVSSLFLFGNRQSLAFQQEIGNSPHKRHHVRFWKTPNKWWLPGGYKADWLGAASYDRKVGISTFTLQFTHKVDADIDEERDYVVSSLQEANRIGQLTVVEHYASGFRSRNGGGDHIVTDGNLPFITLQ